MTTEIRERQCSKCNSNYIEMLERHNLKWLFPEIGEVNTNGIDICRYCLCWSVLLLHYRHAYEGDIYMNQALDNIERNIFNLKVEKKLPNPYRFMQLLDDRMIEIDKKVISVWNIAIDECSSLGPIKRWEELRPNGYNQSISNIIRNILKR